MDAKELKGRAVVALSDAGKIGEVEDVLFDPRYREVLGFLVKRGIFGSPDALLRTAINSIGADAITVSSIGALNARNRFPELSDASTLSHLDGMKVVTEGGDFLGKVTGVDVDDDARNVNFYNLESSLWERVRHKKPQVSVRDMVRIGEDNIMIVTNNAGAQLGSE